MPYLHSLLLITPAESDDRRDRSDCLVDPTAGSDDKFGEPVLLESWESVIHRAYPTTTTPSSQFAQRICALVGHPVKFLPMDFGTMMPMVFGMLGLGAYRAAEKVRGCRGDGYRNSPAWPGNL